MTELHRDDIPYEDAEGIVAELKAMYPGMEVVFAGDMPEDRRTPELTAAMAALEDMHRKLRENGQCIDCGRQMPGWPDPTAEELAKWPTFTKTPTDELMGYQCPECDAAEEAEQNA